MYTSGKPSLSLTLVKDAVCLLQYSEHSYNIVSSGRKYSAGEFNVHISSKMALGEPRRLVFIPSCVSCVCAAGCGRKEDVCLPTLSRGSHGSLPFVS